MRALRRTHYPDKHLLAASPMSAEMLTLPELAEHLGCSVRTLHRRRTAAGPSAPHGTRMGRRLYFPRTAVESWAGEHLVSTRARLDGLTGVLLDHVIEPGSPEWLTRMSASKIAAVVGLSPYESRFSLWHRMAGLTDGQPENDEMREGHYLEPAIAAWFADQHPTWRVETTGTWIAADDDSMAASPDRLVIREDGTATLLQAKKHNHSWEWGEPGSDVMPPGIRAQVVWEMHVTGARDCWVGVHLPFSGFQQHHITYDADEAVDLQQRAAVFMASLPTGANPERPNLDDHAATFEAVKQLHPEIDPVDVEITAELADRYVTAKAAARTATAAERAATTGVLDEMGSAQTATCCGMNVAKRQPGRGGGHPYLKQTTGSKAYGITGSEA